MRSVRVASMLPELQVSYEHSSSRMNVLMIFHHSFDQPAKHLAHATFQAPQNLVESHFASLV